MTERLVTRALQGDAAAAGQLVRNARRSGQLRLELLGWVCLSHGDRSSEAGRLDLRGLFDRGMRSGDRLFQNLSGERWTLAEKGVEGLRRLVGLLPDTQKTSLESLESTDIMAQRAGLLPRLSLRIVLGGPVVQLVRANGCVYGLVAEGPLNPPASDGCIFRVHEDAVCFDWPSVRATVIAAAETGLLYAGQDGWGEIRDDEVVWSHELDLDGVPSALVAAPNPEFAWIGTNTGQLYRASINDEPPYLHRDLMIHSVHCLVMGPSGPVAGRDGGVTLVDPDGTWDRELTTLRSGQSLSGSVADLAIRGTQLVSATGAGHRWDTGQQRCVGERESSGSANAATTVDWDANGHVFVGTRGGWLVDWDGHDEDPGQLIRSCGAPISAALVTERDVWTAGTNGQLLAHPLPAKPGPRPLQQGISLLVRSAQGALLSCGAGGRLGRWSADGVLETLRSVARVGLTSVAEHPVHPLLALGTETGELICVHATTLEVESRTRPRGGDTHALESVFFSPGGQEVALGYEDQRVSVHAWPSAVKRSQTKHGWRLAGWDAGRLLIAEHNQLRWVEPNALNELDPGAPTARPCATSLDGTKRIAVDTSLFEVEDDVIRRRSTGLSARIESVHGTTHGLLVHAANRLSLLDNEREPTTIWPAWMPPFDAVTAQGSVVLLAAQGRVWPMKLTT